MAKLWRKRTDAPDLEFADKVGADRRIPSLDGIRAFAILCVIWGHGQSTIQPWPEFMDVVGYFLPTATFGVQVFFVLSGFLITSLLIREKSKTGTISLKRFYISRAFRILPAYYAFLAVVALLIAFNVIELPWFMVAASALFVRDYVPSGGTWWLGHTWSLSIEEQFYLLWPLIFLFVPRRLLVKLLVIAAVLSPLIRIATWVALPPLRSGIEIMFHTRADGLIIGALLAILWTHEPFRAGLTARIQQGWGWLAPAWLVVSIFCGHLIGNPWDFTVGYLFDAIAVAVIMIWVVEYPQTVAGRVLNWAPLRALGVISFSVYLWQQLFLTTKNETILGSWPLNVLVTLVVATASYWLVEKTFLRLRGRVLRGRQRKTADTPAVAQA